MSCKYCLQESGHSSRCPTNQGEMRTGKVDAAIQYSGTELEYDLFGKVNKGPEYEAAYRAMKPDAEGKISWRNAIELAKRFQDGDPVNPKKDFFRELRIAVQEKLNIDTARHPDALKAYSSVQTPLDQMGVDAFMTWEKDGEECLVTLDATLRVDKIEDGHKADEIITDVPDVEEDEPGYLAAIDVYAGRIAAHFKERTQRRAA